MQANESLLPRFVECLLNNEPSLTIQIALTLATYGVHDVKGIAFGYRGFFDDAIQDIEVRPKTRVQSEMEIGGRFPLSRGGCWEQDFTP